MFVNKLFEGLNFLFFTETTDEKIAYWHTDDVITDVEFLF